MKTLYLRAASVVIGCAAIVALLMNDAAIFGNHHSADRQFAPDVSNLHGVALRSQMDVMELMKSPLTPSDLNKADGVVGSIEASEWLGPLAPIAISPFFGITILAGLAQFGGDWLPANEFISNNVVLKNPAVFWVFLILTVLTSAPRFTKVSKPAAQAIDQVEAYAGIITIILLRVMMMTGDDPLAAEQPVALQAGMFSFTADTLMCIAAIINIIVINTVKFFFEVSVWLVPFPFVDAMLEVANKSVCAALMAIYAYSPIIATIFNLVIFAACLIAFRWIYRRTVYLRTLLFDPVLALAWPGYAVPKKKQLTAFNQGAIGPFAAKSRLLVTPNESGWLLREKRLFLPGKTFQIDREQTALSIEQGVLGNRVLFFEDGQAVREPLVFSRRFTGRLPQLAELIEMNVVTATKRDPSVVTGDLQGI